MLDSGWLEHQIETYLRTARIPGLALAIVQNLTIAYARGFGVTSVEDGALPVTPQTIFRIGSVTKPLTGTAIMRLVEAGQLHLDRPISAYLPWLTFREQGFADRITLRMLLSHTSGLPQSFEAFGRRDADGLEVYIHEVLQHYPFVAPPGTLAAYSNPGINLAGYIAQVASGVPFAELMQTLVFKPLDMPRTTFDPTVAMTYPVAQAHSLDPQKGLQVRHAFMDNVAFYPSGFAMSCVLDLAHFACMHLQQGSFNGTHLLTPQSVAAMHAPQARRYLSQTDYYGLSFIVSRDKGIRRVAHHGDIDSFGCHLVMAPDQGSAIVIMANRITPDRSLEHITNTIFDHLLDLPATPASPQVTTPCKALWPEYTGTYLGDYMGLATVAIAADRLTLDLNGTTVALDALEDHVYQAQLPEQKQPIIVAFIPAADDQSRSIMIDGVPCVAFARDRTFVPNPAAWQAYEGTYTGVNTLIVRLDGEQLCIYSEEDDAEFPCIPLDNTRFACQGALIEFQVADDGSVPMLIGGRTVKFTRIIDSDTPA